MRRAVVVLLVGALSFLTAFAGAALAQGESVSGTLVSRDGTERTPVEGVTVTASLDGEEVGSAVSAADGSWEIPLPGEGVYSVTLDVGTLPQGVTPTDPDRMTNPAVEVLAGRNKPLAFNLGPGVTAAKTQTERFIGLIVSGLKLGAIVAMAAVGLSLVFGVTGLVNFAHGELVTIGAVVAWFLHAAGSGPGWPLLVAAVPAVVVAALASLASEKALWQPLRARQTGNISMMVVSIGLSFAVRNLILVIMGGEPVQYRSYQDQDDLSILGVDMKPRELFMIASALILLGAVGLFLTKTQTGIAMRAVSDNKDLAESSGIDVNGVILKTWLMGGALAGIGGIYLGFEQVEFNMGFKVLLLIFAAVVLGGLGTAFGAMLGGFIVGLAVEVPTFWIDTELKNATALALLIVMLLWRPQGLLGTKERIG